VRTAQWEQSVLRVLEGVGRGQVGGPPGGLTSESAQQLPVFSGEEGEDASEWMEEVQRVGQIYGWNQQATHKAVVSRLRGVARDWHLAVGFQWALWLDWQDEFFRMFGKVWTAERWVGAVTARVQEPGESVMAYSLSKLRLCRKCPFKLTERESVRYLTMGLRDSAYRAVILGSRCSSTMDYLTLVREVGELDQGVGSRLTPSVQANIPAAYCNTPNFGPAPARTPQGPPPPVLTTPAPFSDSIRGPQPPIWPDSRDASVASAVPRRVHFDQSGPRDGGRGQGWPDPRDNSFAAPRRVHFDDSWSRGEDRGTGMGATSTPYRPVRPTGRDCYRCGKFGHIARDCPSAAGNA